MEAEHVFDICQAYEDGKKAARMQQFSNTNPHEKNTTVWLAWIYGWEFGVSKLTNKYGYLQ